MIKKILIGLFLLLSMPALAKTPTIALDHVDVDINNKASIERGAKFFAVNCMSCHTMVYLRYDKMAKNAGVLYEKMPVTVTTWPLGVTPPDLSLEVDVRGADWVYTYLHSFYTDTTRPFGVNNLLVPMTAMPGMLTPFQGNQVMAKDLNLSVGYYNHDLQWYDVLELQSEGSMSAKQFDDTLVDVVNFLNYAAHPYESYQHCLGVFVIGFLIILFILFYLLKKSYWKNLHK